MFLAAARNPEGPGETGASRRLPRETATTTRWAGIAATRERARERTIERPLALWPKLLSGTRPSDVRKGAMMLAVSRIKVNAARGAMLTGLDPCMEPPDRSNST